MDNKLLKRVPGIWRQNWTSGSADLHCSGEKKSLKSIIIIIIILLDSNCNCMAKKQLHGFL